MASSRQAPGSDEFFVTSSSHAIVPGGAVRKSRLITAQAVFSGVALDLTARIHESN